MPDDVASDNAAIIKILGEIVRTQQTELSLIREIHLAATKPVDENSPVNAALKSLATATNNQTNAMNALLEQMKALPDQIGAAMSDQVERALRDV